MISKRISELLTHENLSTRAFEEKINVSQGSINKALKSSTGDIKGSVLNKIVEEFPHISPTWLLTGRGKMEIGVESKTYNAKKIQPTYVDESVALYSNGIPLIPLNALAGIGISQEYQIKDSDIEERYIIPDFDKVKPDYLIRVKGSSMYPKYNSGDIIAIKRVDHSLYIQWNKPYVIDTISNGVLVKRIKQSEQKDHIKLISDNKDYDPFDIPTSDVRSVCIVVGVIRLE